MKGLTCSKAANFCWNTSCKDVGLFVELGQSVAVGVETWYKAGRLSEKGAALGKNENASPFYIRRAAGAERSNISGDQKAQLWWCLTREEKKKKSKICFFQKLCLL